MKAVIEVYGIDEYLDPIDTHIMQLPFNYGWDGWVIFQKGHDEPIYRNENHDLTMAMCRALNTITL